jgi:uncharacterized membrane protein YjjP (DUF1212 family)
MSEWAGATPPQPFEPISSTQPGREQVLEVAARAGDLLLRNGAETYRVEETISRICTAYGFSSEPFALPTGVFASISGSGAPLSIVRRIKGRTIDLGRVARLNAFAREVEASRPGYAEAMSRLDEIQIHRPYPTPYIFLSYALTAAVFTLLYNGSPFEAAAALGIGTLLAAMRLLFMHRSLFPFLEYFTGGLVAGFFSLLATRLIPDLNAYVVITGSLINLMPGTALVNGIRDMLNGDSVSGIARLGEALLSVSIMAAGAAISVGAAMSILS